MCSAGTQYTDIKWWGGAGGGGGQDHMLDEKMDKSLILGYSILQ